MTIEEAKRHIAERHAARPDLRLDHRLEAIIMAMCGPPPEDDLTAEERSRDRDALLVAANALIALPAAEIAAGLSLAERPRSSQA